MLAPHGQRTRLAKLLMLAGLIVFCISLIGAFDGYDSQSTLLSLVGVGLALWGYAMQWWRNA